ncbi:MAG: winged helix-turn-helix domain-containing protein [Dehalococcoidia bacterium]
MTSPLQTQPLTEAQGPVLVLGNLVLNLDTYEATIDGWPVELSYNEFELVGVLATERNRVLPYELIVQRLWKDSDHGSVRHLHVVVHRLRSKLANLRPYEIRTVRGRGYGLVQPLGRGLEGRPE